MVSKEFKKFSLYDNKTKKYSNTTNDMKRYIDYDEIPDDLKALVKIGIYTKEGMLTLYMKHCANM